MNSWTSYEKIDFISSFAVGQSLDDALARVEQLGYDAVICQDLVFIRRPGQAEEIKNQLSMMLFNLGNAQKNQDRLTQLGVEMEFPLDTEHLFFRAGLAKLAAAIGKEVCYDRKGCRVIAHDRHRFTELKPKEEGKNENQSTDQDKTAKEPEMDYTRTCSLADPACKGPKSPAEKSEDRPDTVEGAGLGGIDQGDAVVRDTTLLHVKVSLDEEDLKEVYEKINQELEKLKGEELNEL